MLSSRSSRREALMRWLRPAVSLFFLYQLRVVGHCRGDRVLRAGVLVRRYAVIFGHRQAVWRLPVLASDIARDCVGHGPHRRKGRGLAATVSLGRRARKHFL